MMTTFCHDNLILNCYDSNSEEQKVFGYSLKELPKRIVGYSLVENNKNGWWIDHLFVWPKYRRDGIATTILEQMIKAAKDDGIGCISLLMTKDHLEANGLFSKAGFNRKNAKRKNMPYEILL